MIFKALKLKSGNGCKFIVFNYFPEISKDLIIVWGQILSQEADQGIDFCFMIST